MLVCSSCSLQVLTLFYRTFTSTLHFFKTASTLPCYDENINQRDGGENVPIKTEGRSDKNNEPSDVEYLTVRGYCIKLTPEQMKLISANRK
ncbi:hypothetical protein DX926_00900 [Bacillus atrophaeus]|nr:hypothetical protein DX926_00900 [Bacillus atrophaeus]